MGMFYHIKQLGLIFLKNGTTGFFSFLRMGEIVSMLKVYYQFHIETGWVTVLNQLLHNVPYWQNKPTRQQRFQSNGSQSVFNFLFCRV